MLIKRLKVFGWLMTSTHLQNGGVFATLVKREVAAADLIATTLYTKGTITGESDNPNHAPAMRYPGLISTELPSPIQPNKTVFTAQGDTEFWCLHKGMNGRKTPALQKLVMKAGQQMQLPVGTLLFVCCGDFVLNGNPISTPAPIKVQSQPAQLVATTDVYGLFFDREMD
jgi:hypothetical protein